MYIITYSHSNNPAWSRQGLTGWSSGGTFAAMTSPLDVTRIHEEIKQKAPFRSRSQEAMIAIARTASLIERRTSKVLAPFGVSTAQYNVLRILRGAGPEGLPTLAIRERLIDPAAAITRLVDKLDTAGLLERERTEADRRQVTCRITREGLELLERTDPIIDKLDDMLRSVLSAEELEHFNRQLDRMRAGLRAGGCG